MHSTVRYLVSLVGAVGCDSGRNLTVTGGGVASVELTGLDIETSRMSVDGMSQDTLKSIDSGGYEGYFENLFGELDDPGFEGAWLTDFGPEGESGPVLEVRDHQVLGFAPCGTEITHVEVLLTFDGLTTWGSLQFDTRALSDPPLPSEESEPATLIGSEYEGGLDDLVEFAHGGSGEPSGWSDAAVLVQCPSGFVPATVEVTWDLDPDVRRRVHRSRPSSGCGPTGGWVGANGSSPSTPRTPTATRGERAFALPSPPSILPDRSRMTTPHGRDRNRASRSGRFSGGVPRSRSAPIV